MSPDRERLTALLREASLLVPAAVQLSPPGASGIYGTFDFSPKERPSPG
jgi:hypothetical protein